MAQNTSNPNFDGVASNNFNTAGNHNWLPEVYSKKVQNFFRKAAVGEAITNTDYAGEISAYGDTVNIIQEPTITVDEYQRHGTLSSEELTDTEIQLVVDVANAFQFQVDDIEKRMSHVNFKEVAASSAAYSLKDAFDQGIFTEIFAGISTSAPDHLLGNDSATAAQALDHATSSIDLGHGSGEIDPLAVLARCARLLDEQNVPEEGRWFVAPPEFYELLSDTNSKLMSADYNDGKGSLRNGLVASGPLRGFMMYKSNNTGAPTNADGRFCAGHISAVATAQAILNTEVVRSTTSFADICRGLHVYGVSVLRDEALVGGYYVND